MKTILRSPLVWAALALVFGICVYKTFFVHRYFVDASFEKIWDTDPRYVATYRDYIQQLRWSTLNGIMFYTGPVLFVITSGVVLRRDLGDCFFEIEKAGGVRPATYFFGRFSAVVSFETAVSLVHTLLSFHGRAIMVRGVPGFTLWEYLIDSNVRLLRLFFIAVVPGIVIFTGVTFLAANIAKSGTAGMISGSVYVLFDYMTKTYLNRKMPVVYSSYLNPAPPYLYQYWECYDTEFFTIKFPHNPFTTEQMLLCLCVLSVIAAELTVLSYLCVRRRDV